MFPNVEAKLSKNTEDSTRMMSQENAKEILQEHEAIEKERS